MSLLSNTAMSTLVISVLRPGLYSERTESLIPIAVFRIVVWETDLGKNESVLGKRNSQGLTIGKIHEVVL